jgi:hypothetical protein
MGFVKRRRLGLSRVIVRGRRSLTGRLGWGLADQCLSSITNLGVGIVAGRSVGVRQFGAFGLAFATYLIALGASRALVSMPFLVRHSFSPTESWRSSAAESSGAALVIGSGLGLACIAASSVMASDMGYAFRALGLCLPGLLLQDSWRFAFFAQGKGRLAFQNDLAWAAAMVPLFLFAGSRDPSAGRLLLAWGASAGVAAVYGSRQARVVPRVRFFLAWLRRHWDLAPRYLGEFMAMVGSSQIAIYAVGSMIGLGAVGGFRGSQILLGPLNVVFMGIGLVAIPEGVRLLGTSRKLFRSALTLSLVLFILAVVWSFASLVIPSNIGAALLGDSWVLSRAILFPAGLIMAGNGASMGPVSGLRALGAAREGLVARLIVAPLVPLSGIAGAFVAGLRGAAYGMAFASLAASFVWWSYFWAAMRRHAAPNLSIDGDLEPPTGVQAV